MSPIIQTEADRLISLVDTKGKITAKEAAKVLGLKERQAESMLLHYFYKSRILILSPKIRWNTFFLLPN